MAHGTGYAACLGLALYSSSPMTRVLDYTVKSKHCASCSHWEGGACAMEPSESDQQVKNLDCVRRRLSMLDSAAVSYLRNV